MEKHSCIEMNRPAVEVDNTMMKNKYSICINAIQLIIYKPFNIAQTGVSKLTLFTTMDYVSLY